MPRSHKERSISYQRVPHSYSDNGEVCFGDSILVSNPLTNATLATNVFENSGAKLTEEYDVTEWDEEGELVMHSVVPYTYCWMDAAPVVGKGNGVALWFPRGRGRSRRLTPIECLKSLRRPFVFFLIKLPKYLITEGLLISA